MDGTTVGLTGSKHVGVHQDQETDKFCVTVIDKNGKIYQWGPFDTVAEANQVHDDWVVHFYPRDADAKGHASLVVRGAKSEGAGKGLNISFSYDSLKIIAVFGSQVHVEGKLVIDNHDEPVVCVLKMERKLFLQTVNMWLEAKKEHCERYNRACGTLGRLRATEYEMYPDPTITVTAFDASIDMEHG